jgi:hypothetical protein
MKRQHLQCAVAAGPATITFTDDVLGTHKAGNGSKNGVVLVGDEVIELGRVVEWRKGPRYCYRKVHGKRRRWWPMLPVFEARRHCTRKPYHTPAMREA